MAETKSQYVRRTLQSFQRELWQEWDSAPPPELYHYTTRCGLHGILSKKQLWLTDCASLHLNDPREGRYWLDVVRPVLNRKSVPHYVRESFYIDVGGYVPGSRWYSYIACTSGERRLRHQWKRYAEGMRGYALGLRYDTLMANADGGRKYAVFRVLYDPAEQTRAVERTLDHALQLRRDLGPGRSESREYWLDVAFVLVTIGQRFKPVEYQRENEWRLFVTEVDTANAKDRIDADGRQIRYRELALEDGMVSRVTRTSRCPERDNGALALLQQAGFWGIDVECIADQELLDV